MDSFAFTFGLILSFYMVGTSARMDDDGFDTIIGMHENVRTSLSLIGVTDLEEAEEACVVLQTLMQQTYSGSAKYTSKVLDIPDLALISCEYTCLHKELREQGVVDAQASADNCARYLLRRLPDSLDGCSDLRKRMVTAAQRHPELHTGWDGDNARNCLSWWLATSLKGVNSCSVRDFFDDERCYCVECGLVKSLTQSLDPRSKFCCDECRWSSAAREAKGRRRS